MLKPRYYDQGVDAYWLDETDGEGTAGGGDGDMGYNTSYGVTLGQARPRRLALKINTTLVRLA